MYFITSVLYIVVLLSFKVMSPFSVVYVYFVQKMNKVVQTLTQQSTYVCKVSRDRVGYETNHHDDIG